MKADNTDRKLGSLALCLVIVGALTAILGLWWTSSRAQVNFLPEMAPAKWIVYPVIPEADTHPVLELPTTFEDSFVLDAVPSKALLRIAGFRRYTLAVNGTSPARPLWTGTNWKQPDAFDVASKLRPGVNRVEVTVFNSNGPPALWFSLAAGPLQINSGEAWQASYAGATRCAAVPASAPKPMTTGSSSYGLPRPLAALGMRWPTILGFALLSAVGWWVLSKTNPSPSLDSDLPLAEQGTCLMAANASKWSWKRLSARWRSHQPPRQTYSRPRQNDALQSWLEKKRPGWIQKHRETLPVVILTGFWLSLFAHNLPMLPCLSGFDAQVHVDYIRYIQEHNSLPMASQGVEMFQPPLYYLLSAMWLNLLHLSVTEPGGIAALRLLGLAAGVIHFIVVWATLRLLFPADRSKARWGLLLAACLPPMLYLSQFITNEVFAAMMASACIWLTLRALKEECVSWRSCAALGLCLGAALLTKSTALLVAPPIFGALLWKWLAETLAGQMPQSRAECPASPGSEDPTFVVTAHSRREPSDSATMCKDGNTLSFAQWAARLCLIAALCALVGGWHYARLWIHYGNPLIGDWDPKLGFPWWQDDGYRTITFYQWSGDVLLHPWSGAVRSFCDGMYATLWGDGLLGSATNFSSPPPWNYDLMAVGYWFALVPTLAVAAGGVLILLKFVRRPSAEWFLLLGFGALVLWALLHMSLVVPCFGQLKAFYGLSALTPFCAFGALGLDFLTRRSTMLRSIFCVMLGLWAINSYACFWISPSSDLVAIERVRTLVQNGRFPDAIDFLQQRLRSDPGNINLQFSLAYLLSTTGQVDEGARLAATMVHEHPDDCRGHHVLALALARQGQTEKAIDEIRKTMALAPGYDPSWKNLSSLLVAQGHPDETISLARQALAAAPFSPELRVALGSALVFKDQEVEAAIQLRYACLLDPRSADTLAGLAWKLATDPSPAVRNGPVAVRLAGQACELTAYHRTAHMIILAAACAEAAQYPEAVETAERARASALASGDSYGATVSGKLIELFKTGQPYREASGRAQKP